MLPDYVLIGDPRRFKNGRGNAPASYLQKYRLLTDPPRKLRSVSLRTCDLTVARRRSVRFVEDRIREDLLARDPQARTSAKGIAAALKEYLADLTASGNTAKQVNLVRTRILRVISQAKLKEFAQVDAVIVKRAISKLMAKHEFGIVTANK